MNGHLRLSTVPVEDVLEFTAEEKLELIQAQRTRNKVQTTPSSVGVTIHLFIDLFKQEVVSSR